MNTSTHTLLSIFIAVFLTVACNDLDTLDQGQEKTDCSQVNQEDPVFGEVAANKDCYSKETVQKLRAQALRTYYHDKTHGNSAVMMGLVLKDRGLNTHEDGTPMLPRLEYVDHLIKQHRKVEIQTVPNFVEAFSELDLTKAMGEAEESLTKSLINQVRKKAVSAYFVMFDDGSSVRHHTVWIDYTTKVLTPKVVNDFLRHREYLDGLITDLAKKGKVPPKSLFFYKGFSDEDRVRMFHDYVWALCKAARTIATAKDFITFGEELVEAGYKADWVNATVLDALVQHKFFRDAFKFAIKHADEKTADKVEALHRGNMERNRCYSVVVTPLGENRIYDLHRGCVD